MHGGTFVSRIIRDLHPGVGSGAMGESKQSVIVHRTMQKHSEDKMKTDIRPISKGSQLWRWAAGTTFLCCLLAMASTLAHAQGGVVNSTQNPQLFCAPS